MLEEKDRRALADIELHLCADDPEFARRMRADDRRFPTVSVLCVLVFLTLPFVGLFSGPGAVLVTVNVAAVVVTTILLIRGRRRRREL
ncbi:DUF3040 domain-containing protein [Actinoplanes teichomyceticus]|uniref:DUF3040 family protein n=1 Tax=Actinoplanes teichomyceticus TaxID=1867 RepID=A0A561VMU1_ACTTI|nr:DUF3040 domain-containing protein [Actinoplanes teichomyceticus]TWG12939.1 DUF3040 family protein [Actinoplanes teichomyceticus]GIF13694.1 hypothetical protein Ate01nite_37260 [Actinoplanes teichomyceticus]